MNSIKKSKQAERRWIPDGFHFLGPEESKERRRLIKSLTSSFEEAGYSEINLPAFDYTSSFQSFIGGLEPSAFLTAKDYDGYVLSPGVDLTLQVVKGMASRSHWEENQNVYYVGRKIRDHKKKNASRREILQIGGESFGNSSPQNVIEQIQILERMWKKSLPDTRASFVLGHAGILSSIMDMLGLDPSHNAIISQYLFTKNVPELENFVRTLGLKEELFNLLPLVLKPISFTNFSEFKNKLLLLTNNLNPSAKLSNDLADAEAFIRLWNERSIGFDGIWDLSLIRDLDYYSGLVFQGFMHGYTEPVFAGGVYNELYESYTDVKKDACGFALHIDPLEEMMYSRKKR